MEATCSDFHKHSRTTPLLTTANLGNEIFGHAHDQQSGEEKVMSYSSTLCRNSEHLALPQLSLAHMSHVKKRAVQYHLNDIHDLLDIRKWIPRAFRENMPHYFYNSENSSVQPIACTCKDLNFSVSTTGSLNCGILPVALNTALRCHALVI